MFSEYFNSLNVQAKERYSEKIKVINGKDPYILPLTEFSSKLDDFPEVNYIDLVNYLVYGISAYTFQEFKSYKSLKAYNLFQCSWVFDIYVKKERGMHLVIGKVSVQVVFKMYLQAAFCIIFYFSYNQKIFTIYYR